jgi:hypothetical protein
LYSQSATPLHIKDQQSMPGQVEDWGNTSQLAKFDTTQKTATIHLETFPKGQAFAFKE